MTKTLTEQWREGTLESGHYYIRSGLSTSIEIRYLGNGFFEGNIEVLAPVPSYDKVKEMSQKIERLEFDNEALEMAHNEGKEINAELVSKTDKLEKKLEISMETLKKIADYQTDVLLQYWAEGALNKIKEMEGVK